MSGCLRLQPNSPGERVTQYVTLGASPFQNGLYSDTPKAQRDKIDFYTLISQGYNPDDDVQRDPRGSLVGPLTPWGQKGLPCRTEIAGPRQPSLLVIQRPALDHLKPHGPRSGGQVRFLSISLVSILSRRFCFCRLTAFPPLQRPTNSLHPSLLILSVAVLAECCSCAVGARRS